MLSRLQTRHYRAMAPLLFSRPVPVPSATINNNHIQNGLYVLPWDSAFQGQFWPSFLQMLCSDWLWGRVTLPLQHPDWPSLKDEHNLSLDRARITWLGHSSFLLQIGGLNILTDPIFNERASALQFVGPKRIVPVPGGSLSKLVPLLPDIDIVLVSHNHYDHLCSDTVVSLQQAFNPVFFVPSGVGSLMENCGIENYVEMGWWHHSTSNTQMGKVDIVNLPVQHTSGRTLWDRGSTLCSSYLVNINHGETTRKLFFAGDTGYRNVPRGYIGCEEDLPRCPVFQEIGEFFGPLDLSLIPIGAYSPRWFTSTMHLSPEDAVDVHVDLKSRQSIGMHWGTFLLTEEPPDEPPQRLKNAVLAKGLNEKDFDTMIHGETRLLNFDVQPQDSYEKEQLLPTTFINKKAERTAEFRKEKSID